MSRKEWAAAITIAAAQTVWELTEKVLEGALYAIGAYIVATRLGLL